jgi:hypothetical protein
MTLPMRSVFAVVGLGISMWLFGCTAKQTVRPNDQERRGPGGTCYWSVKEGGPECSVVISGDTRKRTLGGDIEETEGHGEFQWKCGERQMVCGGMVECTCPFALDAGTKGPLPR